MKKSTSILIAVCVMAMMLFASTVVFAAAPFEGSGTENDPYLIQNYEDLCKLSELVNNGEGNYGSAYYLQTADIIANEGTFSLDKNHNPLWNGKAINETNMPVKWKAIGTDNSFYGTYDGANYLISGLYSDSLFSNGQNAILNNIILDNSLANASIGYSTNGGIIKSLSNGTISGCINNAIVIHKDHAAGIAGYVYATEIINCANTGEIYSKEGIAAGICGRPYDNSIINCINYGDIFGALGAAGICGAPHPSSMMETIIVESCANFGNIKSNNAASGIATEFWGKINYCYNLGDITGNTAAGICTYLKQQPYGTSDILQCNNYGNISGKTGKFGGIAATMGKECTIAGCANIGNVTPENAMITGGICGEGEGQIGLCANYGNIQGGNSVGGILGKAKNMGVVVGSYNMGNVSGKNFVGGILGDLYSGLIYGTSEYYQDNNYVACCYNAGNISSSTSYYGAIAGAQSLNTIDTCYYLNTSAPKAIGIDYDGTAKTKAKSAADMKKAAFVKEINGYESIFAQDTKNINSGYPVLIGVYPVIFDDVPPNSYYMDAVIWALFNGVTTGISETSFGPDMPCTRAQFVTFLWRAAGCPEPESSTCAFTDCKSDQYYYPAVLWAVENGVTDGTSATTFSPDKTVNRAEVITFLWKYDGKPAASGSEPFSDVTDGDWFSDAVKWGYANGLAKGMSDTIYGSAQNCTRAQTVTFLYRYFAE